MTAGASSLALALLGPLACSTKENNNGFLPPTGSGGIGGSGGTTPNGMVEVTITAPWGQATVSQNGGLQVSATVGRRRQRLHRHHQCHRRPPTASGSTTPLAVGQLVSSGH